MINLISRFVCVSILLCVVYIANAQPYARKIIRDTEIENDIRFLMTNIFEKSGFSFENVNFYIVDDPVLNAFVSGGQNIFIHTGLLLSLDKPEELIGVLSHELGHIRAGHLARIQDAQTRAQQAALLAAAISVPLAILSKSRDGLAGGLVASQSVGLGVLTGFTREMENEADQFALEIMEKAMVNRAKFGDFMKKIKNEEYLYGAEGGYFRTHPLTNDRINSLQSALKPEDYTRNLPQINHDLLNRIKAKIFGYQKPEEALKFYAITDISLPALLAKSIAYSRLNKSKEALEIAINLTNQYPNDPFLWENLGDIYSQAGLYNDAIGAYNKSIAFIPWASLILMQKAYAINQLDDKKYQDEIIQTLNQVLANDKNSLEAYGLLAKWYEIAGNKRASSLNQAEASYRIGDFKRAEFHLKIVQNGVIDKLSLRAQDINQEIQNLKKISN